MFSFTECWTKNVACHFTKQRMLLAIKLLATAAAPKGVPKGLGWRETGCRPQT